MTQQTQKTQPSQAQKAEAKPKQAPKNPVNNEDYSKYTDLKFLQLSLNENPDSEIKIKEQDLKTLNELEEKIKKCSGKVPVRTVRAAVGNEQCLLVKGIPVPENIEKIIKEWEAAGVKGAYAYYFG